MAHDWITIIDQPFTFAQIRARTATVLDELLGGRPPDVDIVALNGQSVRRHRRLTDVEMVPESELVRVQTPTGTDANFYLFIPALDANVWILTHYHPEGMQYDEDIEFYTSFLADPGRTNTSTVLGIATIIAAAEILGSVIIDDGGTLNHGDVIDPAVLLNDLRPRTAFASWEEAVARVVAQTDIRYSS